jgi:hypothetical protein
MRFAEARSVAGNFKLKRPSLILEHVSPARFVACLMIDANLNPMSEARVNFVTPRRFPSGIATAELMDRNTICLVTFSP